MLPRPRRIELTDAVATRNVRSATTDASLAPQGYRIELTAEGAHIVAADPLGHRYAQATLDALPEAQLRVGTLEDWPDFVHRAFMLDVSRDRVPTNDTLDWLVDILGRLRYTELQLYVEHTYAFAGHERVWRDSSPLTADDLRRLDERCADAGIELVANLNTFGHMDRWLRHEPYRDLAECPDGSPALFGPAVLPPWSLEPTPDNAAFARGLATELASVLRSDRVNIGADEPFDLGRGRSADAVAARGRAAVYLEHLRRIVEPLVDDGHDVQFWGDVLRRHPELVSQLPRHGATAVVWNYEAPSPNGPTTAQVLGQELVELLGLPDDAHLGFAAHVRSFATTGYPFWVAAGTSSWNTLFTRWPNARANLLDAAVVGRRDGARGFMVTDWGDHGHHQPLPVSLPALVYGAAVAWSAEGHAELDVRPIVDDLLDAPAGTGALLTSLGSLDATIGRRMVNGSAIAAILHARPPMPLFGTADIDGLAAAEATFEAAAQAFASMELAGPRGRAIAAELHAAAALARHGVHRLQRTAGNGPLDDAALQQEFDAVVARQRAAWLGTSRPGGLEDSLAKLCGPVR